MPAIRINMSATSLILLAAVIAMAGYQSLANRPAPAGPAQPAIIATFDLEKTFNSLNMKKQADIDLQKLADSMNADADAQKKAIQQMETEIEDHLPGSEKHKELLEKMTMDSQNYRAYVEFCKWKIDSERARTLRKIYADIRAVVQELASENHYAVVFVDDSISPIPPGTEEETNRQISARRMVFTSDEVDITESLIQRMNGRPANPAPKANAQAPGQNP